MHLSAASAGTYEDTFYPDPSTDLIIDYYGHSWTVTVDHEKESGTAVGPLALLSGHGLIEFTPDTGTLQLGRATCYRRKPSS